MQRLRSEGGICDAATPPSVYVELRPLAAHRHLVDHLFILRDCGRLTGPERSVFASPFCEVALVGQRRGAGDALVWQTLQTPPRFGRQPRPAALHGWLIGVRYDPLLSGPEDLAALQEAAADLDRVVGRDGGLDAIVHLLDRALDAGAATEPGIGRPAPGSRQRQTIGAWTRALSAIGADGVVKVAELAGATRIPARTLQRHVRARTGLSPKRYTALRRFDAALRGVAGGEAAFADVAMATGYADQSHMTVDLAQHTGASPGRLRAFARRQNDQEAVRFFQDAAVRERIRLFINAPEADGEMSEQRRRATGPRIR